MTERLQLAKYLDSLKTITCVKLCGRVKKVVGLVIEGSGPSVPLGGICEICSPPFPPLQAEIVGFREESILLMPLGKVQGLEPGCLIQPVKVSDTIKVGRKLLGRVINALGQPIDGLEELCLEEEYPLSAQPLGPFQRERISRTLDVGIRAINSLLTIGRGQKIGIMAGSGVGKSVLLGQMAKNTEADINVIALIGERGREVREFIEKDLGKEGLKRSVLVVATSDEPPLLRRRGAFVGTAIAEYFRHLGYNVLLMMDSLTRFAMAQREIGLAIGEPPTTRGYTPSVFTLLPALLERVGGINQAGSITGLYTVLVEGDDMNEPIADSARSILDGHIVLSRELAHRHHFPAIDILSSLSRVMSDITSPEHRQKAQMVLEILATYKKIEDLVHLGAYKKGNNPKVDYALEMIDPVTSFLRQSIGEKSTIPESLKDLHDLLATHSSIGP